MIEELIGKFVRDKDTGDIGQILQLKYRNKYYLVKWVHIEEGSWHNTKINDRREYYAQYTPQDIVNSQRFEILTGQEAFMWVL